MDDIDEHLFMLVRLRGDTGQEIAVLVMPMLNTPSPAGFIRKNFDIVFGLFSVVQQSLTRSQTRRTRIANSPRNWSGSPLIASW